MEGQLEDSLRALNTDHIDVYLMHSAPTDQIEHDELWTMLDKAKAAGKIRATGLSLEGGLANNVLHTQLAEKYGCSVIELVYNAIDNGPEKETLPLCRKYDMGVLARVPLAQGYLSGKYKPGTVFAKSDVRSYYYKPEVSNERLVRAQEIIAREVPAGVNPAQWAMAWSVKNPAVAACIPGSKHRSWSGEKAVASSTDDHRWPSVKEEKIHETIRRNLFRPGPSAGEPAPPPGRGQDRAVIRRRSGRQLLGLSLYTWQQTCSVL